MATDTSPDPPTAILQLHDATDLFIYAASDSTVNAIGKKTTSIPSRTPKLSNAWEFAGWGATCYITLTPSTDTSPKPTLLGVYRSTAIAGNAFLASVLYSTGPVLITCGPLAPIATLLATVLFYPLITIIAEVVTALPFNGGSYSVLLNSTSKLVACIAASFTLFDYAGAAVVAAASATSYAATLLDGMNVVGVYVGIMVFFALVAVMGTRDSATLSLLIFGVHLVTLTMLMVACVVYMARHPLALMDNLGRLRGAGAGDVVLSLFKGYCLALLGMTGFEQSCNFVQEQSPGVYPKTLRNMWWMSVLYNIPMSLLTLAILPLETVEMYPDNTLSVLAAQVGGSWLWYLVAVDAVVVLCAGVLTAFIGIAGTIVHLAQDGVLPRFLLERNARFGSYHYAILSFLVVCLTLYFCVLGNVYQLSVIYAMVFIVMVLIFSLGNLMLKYKRGRLPRTIRSSTFITLIAAIGLVVGLCGNLYLNRDLIGYFFLYFVFFFVISQVVLHRAKLAKTLYFYMDKIKFVHTHWSRLPNFLVRHMNRWSSKTTIFFTNTDEIYVLNKAILYAVANESAGRIKIVHIIQDEESERVSIGKLKKQRQILDELHPKITVDLVFAVGTFSPDTVLDMSRHLNVPTSMMFMACPGPGFAYGIQEFNGVRIIML
jgi:amino acid transporter